MTHALQMLTAQPNKNMRCTYNSLFVVSICAFLYLFALWEFAELAVKLMKIISWFAGALSICICFLKLEFWALSATVHNHTSMFHWCECLHISADLIYIVYLALTDVPSSPFDRSRAHFHHFIYCVEMCQRFHSDSCRPKGDGGESQNSTSPEVLLSELIQALGWSPAYSVTPNQKHLFGLVMSK